MNIKLIFFLLAPSFVFAQQTVDVEKENVSPTRDGLFFVVSGTAFSPYKYIKVVEGTPYFNESWMKGVAVLANGGKTKCDYLKLDLLSGDVIYKDSAGRVLTATTPLSHLTLTDSVTGKNYVFRNSSVSPFSSKKLNIGWYQLLETGTATLYKKIKKSTSDASPFNSATTEQTINTKFLYFIEIGNDITAVKTLRDISIILSDKKKELDDFIANSKLTGKTDADFIEVVAKYNLLAVSH